MKKALIGVGAVIVLLVAAVLIVPSFIDWNQYKGEAQALAKEFTGRELAIDGDIRLTILPAPGAVIENVRFANAVGATDPEMVTLKSAEVRVALGPLLGGHVQVETIKLVEPVISLETLADGRLNLPLEAMADPEAAAAPAEPPAGGDGDGPAFALQLDDVRIEDGVVVYRDAASGTVERVDGIDARLAAASLLEGPYEATGRLNVRGVPLSFDAAVGTLIEDRTMPFRLKIEADAGNARAEVGGTVSGLADAPRFKGSLKAGGDDLAALVAAVAAAPLPPILAQAFAIEGTLTGTETEAAIEDLSVALGETRATGAVRVGFADRPTADIQLGVGTIDIDSWLDAASPTAAGGGQAGAGGSAPAGVNEPAAAVAIPTDIDVAAALAVEAATFRGGVIRQIRANAELAAGEITVSQLSAQLPGGSEFAVFGFVTADDTGPRFDGEIEASASDLRGVFRWLGVEVPPMPAERLRKFDLTGKLAATSAFVQAREVDLRFDASRITGGVTLAVSERPSFGADVTVDQINLDSYLAVAGTDAVAESNAAATAEPAEPMDGAGGPFSALSALTAFDANLKARLKSLIYEGTPIREVVVDATLFDGALEIRRASVGDLAGASANVTGGLERLDGTPQAAALEMFVKAPDLVRLFKFAGVDPPPQARTLGAASVAGRLDGPLPSPRLALTLQAAGGEARLDGAATLLPAPAFEGRVALRQDDLVRLLRALAVDYRPAGTVGATDVGATVAGSAAGVTLTDLAGTLAGVDVKGALAVALAGDKPKVTADLATGALVVDAFLPAERTAGLTPMLVPASWRPGPVPSPPPSPGLRRIAVNPRWSPEPIDLTALHALDADVKLRSPAITYDAYTLEQADIRATLTGGVLTAEKVNGVLFGGPLQAAARVDAAAATPRIDATVSLQGADVGRAAMATSGKPMASGRLGLETALVGGGRSVADLVSSLNGSGRVALTGVDVTAAARGSALTPLLGLLQGLGQIGTGLAGQPAGDRRATLTGTYRVENGVMRSNDLRLAYYLGDGQATAAVDLPRWRIDAEGRVDLAPNLLTGLLAQATGGSVPESLPFKIQGPLDGPNVKLETAGLAAGAAGAAGALVPGLDKLREKSGIGKVLDALAPKTQGGSQTPSEPSSGDELPPPPAQQQQQRTITPQKLLEGLFNR